MTIEELEQRVTALKQAAEQLVQQFHQVNGQLAEAQFWLQQLKTKQKEDTKTTKTTEKGKTND